MLCTAYVRMRPFPLISISPVRGVRVRVPRFGVSGGFVIRHFTLFPNP